MTPGKMAAQAGHAYLDAYLKAMETNPLKAKKYNSDGPGTKIALEVKNSDHLQLIYQETLLAAVPCAIIEDSGHIIKGDKNFTGEPVITALGIGPATRGEIKHITKKLKLVR